MYTKYHRLTTIVSQDCFSYATSYYSINRNKNNSDLINDKVHLTPPSLNSIEKRFIIVIINI